MKNPNVITSSCAYCDEHVFVDKRLAKGNLVICIFCHSACVFTKEEALQKLSKEEVEKMKKEGSWNELTRATQELKEQREQEQKQLSGEFPQLYRWYPCTCPSCESETLVSPCKDMREGSNWGEITCRCGEILHMEIVNSKGRPDLKGKRMKASLTDESMTGESNNKNTNQLIGWGQQGEA